jgi:hypothetical protein
MQHMKKSQKATVKFFAGKGYGITDGEKWFYYAYAQKDAAQSVLDKIMQSAISGELIKANVNRDEPLTVVQ